MICTFVPHPTTHHDGEDEPAVLVNVAAPHAEDPVGRPGRRQGGKRQLHRHRVAVAGRVGGGGELRSNTRLNYFIVRQIIKQNAEKTCAPSQKSKVAS